MRIFLFALALVVCLILGLTVWPTIYRYDHFQRGENTWLIRTNRITGTTQVLTPQDGWVTMGVHSDEGNR
jgi:hypothetical protein